MHVTIVQLQVKRAHVEDFIVATRRNHLESVQEPGNRRFDVLQLVDDPTRFVLYEAYESPEDAAAHKHTAHYRAWRDAVESWMMAPRVGVNYRGLLPE